MAWLGHAAQKDNNQGEEKNRKCVPSFPDQRQQGEHKYGKEASSEGETGPFLPDGRNECQQLGNNPAQERNSDQEIFQKHHWDLPRYDLAAAHVLTGIHNGTGFSKQDRQALFQ